MALTAAIAIVIGILGLLAGLLRLGFIASFISEPVLKGFIVGLALTIVIGQVPKLLGVDKADGNFFQQAWGVVTDLPDIDWLTAADRRAQPRRGAGAASASRRCCPGR